MPTANPRVNVTLSATQYQLLSRLAKAQGVSRSAVLLELLDTVTPVLERVVVAVEAAEKAQEQARDGLRDSVTKAEAAILPHVQAAMGQFDWLLEQATEAASPRKPEGKPRLAQPDLPRGGKSARRPRRPSPAPGGKATPVPVTRGSGRGARGALRRARRR